MSSAGKYPVVDLVEYTVMDHDVARCGLDRALGRMSQHAPCTCGGLMHALSNRQWRCMLCGAHIRAQRQRQAEER